MLKRVRPYGAAFAPAALWAVLIFTLSGTLGSSLNTGRIIIVVARFFGLSFSPQTVILINTMWRTCTHLFLYMVYAVLLLRGFRALPSGVARPGDRFVWIWTMVIVVVSALIDEYHQWLVPARSGRFADVLLDCFGAATGLVGTWLLERWRGRLAFREGVAG